LAESPVRPALLWFGLFGAAAAWSLQELASYAILAHGCFPAWRPLAALSSPADWSAALGVSVAALLIGVTASLTAYCAWQRTGAGEESHTTHLDVGEGRERFMALSGIIVSLIMLANILMNAVVLLSVPACG
jgi:hypothetical protein